MFELSKVDAGLGEIRTALHRKLCKLGEYVYCQAPYPNY